MKTTNNTMNQEKDFAVACYLGNGQHGYVGSVLDYKSGEIFSDPVMMTEEDAKQLFKDLRHYVLNEEKFKDDETRDAALWAFTQNEWGFVVEDLNFEELS